MENFEVRAKSFTIKWINAPDKSVIKWELKPLKKSINFGIYKYNKSDLPPPRTAPNSSSTTISENLSLDEVNEVPHKLFNLLHQTMSDSFDSVNSTAVSTPTTPGDSSANLVSKANQSSSSVNTLAHERRRRSESLGASVDGSRGQLEEKMDKHLVRQEWIGRCQGDELISGSFQVTTGSLFAFVFDNTFSRHKAKTIMFNQYIELLASEGSANVQQEANQKRLSIDTTSTQKNIPNFEVSPKLPTSSSQLDPISEHLKNEETEHSQVEQDSSAPPEHLKDSSQKRLSMTFVAGPIASPTAAGPPTPTAIQPTTPALTKVPTSGSSHVKFNLPEDKQPSGAKNASLLRIKGGQYLQGWLLKKKRRRGGAKNFSRRFFVLNFKYGSLDYYFNDLTNHVRGNMYIKNVVISADPKQMMMYLDSGIEQWVLKALNQDDFKIWVQAFNFIKKQNKQDLLGYTSPSTETSEVHPQQQPLQQLSSANPTILSDQLDDNLNSNISSPLEEVRVGRSAHVQTQPNPQFRDIEEKIASIKELTDSLLATAKQSSASDTPKRSASERRGSTFFWKKNRKDSMSPTNLSESAGVFEQENLSLDRNSVDKNFSASSSASIFSPTQGRLISELSSKINDLQLQYMLLVNTETNRGFSRPPPLSSPSRKPLSRTTTAATSVVSQDFFDAQEYIDEINRSVYMVGSSGDEDDEDEEATQNIHQDTEFNEREETLFHEDIFAPGADLSNSSSSGEEDEGEDIPEMPVKTEQPIQKPEQVLSKDLSPLQPNVEVSYRTDINPCKSEPPSLVAFLRKNIGKDLSTISMPVTANEPLTFLQKYAESFEYAKLLNDSVSAPMETGERILMIACFAVTYLSSYRAKMRNNRKPFNPLLGETFELARNDLGIRLLAEKVVHRPAIFAVHVDSKEWEVDHILSPQQKFGGKSAEVSILGELILKFRDGETYKWTQPTTLLKNLIAGEKYCEPYSSMTVTCNNGYKAVVNFKASGMFSGRSEDLNIRVFNSRNEQLPKEVSGTWTESLNYSDTGKIVWQAGKLVPNYQKKYGFTVFAAGLNQVTKFDESCAPTDSRLRPDQREYENGNIEEAERLKVVLESEQRKRRKDPEGNDVEHVPSFFSKVGDGDFDWEFIGGENNYWERRRRGDWENLVHLW